MLLFLFMEGSTWVLQEFRLCHGLLTKWIKSLIPEAVAPRKRGGAWRLHDSFWSWEAKDSGSVMDIVTLRFLSCICLWVLYYNKWFKKSFYMNACKNYHRTPSGLHLISCVCSVLLYWILILTISLLLDYCFSMANASKDRIILIIELKYFNLLTFQFFLTRTTSIQ